MSKADVLELEGLYTESNQQRLFQGIETSRYVRPRTFLVPVNLYTGALYAYYLGTLVPQVVGLEITAEYAPLHQHVEIEGSSGNMRE